MRTPTPTPTTADLFDEHGDELGSCDLQFRQFGGHRSFSGRVSTIRCFQDIGLVRTALSGPGEGRVLVVDGGGSLHTALFGDRAAQLAIDNGWAGVVIYGAVRDTAALAEMSLGVKALGSNPQPSTNTGDGDLDVAVSFGEATFRPGDQLWSDDDGVVILPG